MKIFLLALLILGTCPSYADENRIERDARSQAEFKEAHFFAEGNGMHLSPNLLNLTQSGLASGVMNWGREVFAGRWGLNWSESDRLPTGLFLVPYRRMTVPVLGCVACHSGKANGQWIVGIGNKNIDPQHLGEEAHFAERLWKAVGHFGIKDADYRAVEDSALSFTSKLANSNIGNLTQGLVPTSVIRTWFYEVQDQQMPEAGPRGAVKVPALFGWGAKRDIGQFCDGLGSGSAWGVAVELAAGQTQDVTRRILPQAKAVDDMFAAFLPPKYNGLIDPLLAAKGKDRFDHSCAQCHGTYENDGDALPIYKAPNYVAWDDIRTDRDRLDGNTLTFLDLIRNSPLSDLMGARLNMGAGYFSPRLHGVWARFPYLHNASVPNVEALLTPPALRPTVFSLKDSGEVSRFDSIRLGLTVPESGSSEERRLLQDAAQGERSVYWTERPGQSAQGHDFYTGIAEEEKAAVIEYLKTL